MKAGLLVTLVTPDGQEFQCPYRREDAASAFEAMQRIAMRQTRYYILSIEPCDEPPKPPTLAEYAARGGNMD